MATPSSDSAGIRQSIRALRNAGYSLVAVDDGGYYEPAEGGDSDGDQIVSNETQAIEAITAVDDARLFVKNGDVSGWVRYVMGNSPEEVICDYTVNLSHVLDALIDSWD